ncbi:MAG: metal-sulfur cluster assembly factor, partial [Janthinobacterium lividum]
MTPETLTARDAEVWARLDGVVDPELDESVTELGFVTAADIDAESRVAIAFRLPTYWCAANFAFLMADDMRVAVASLPWVRGVTVRLGEHMYADTINDGLARGLSFRESFGAEADGDLDALRRTFLVKAYQRRQKALLDSLAAAGHAPAAVVAMTVADLADVPLDAAGAAALRRYLERRDVIAPSGPEAPAFLDAAGAPLDPAALPAYLR